MRLVNPPEGLSDFFRVRKKFFPLIESGLFNFDDPEQRELLRSVLMTSCDIASICKPWHIQRQVADLVVSEFFQQGDKVGSLALVNLLVSRSVFLGTSAESCAVFIIPGKRVENQATGTDGQREER